MKDEAALVATIAAGFIHARMVANAVFQGMQPEARPDVMGPQAAIKAAQQIVTLAKAAVPTISSDN